MLPDRFPISDFADSACINPNSRVLVRKVGFASIGVLANLGDGRVGKACYCGLARKQTFINVV
jgi:hypothetical protein